MSGQLIFAPRDRVFDSESANLLDILFGQMIELLLRLGGCRLKVLWYYVVRRMVGKRLSLITLGEEYAGSVECRRRTGRGVEDDFLVWQVGRLERGIGLDA